MGHKVQFEWELPEAMLSIVTRDKTQVAEEVKLAAVLDWVRMKKISLRKGAELLGIEYRDFLALVAEHKIPTLDYEEGWTDKELLTFEKVKSDPGS